MSLFNYIITASSNIREAIKQIDQNGEGFVVVVDDNNKVVGLLTDGDFRRAILSGISLSENCLIIANREFKYVEKNATDKEKINIFLQFKIEHLPVLEDGALVGMLKRNDFDLSDKIVLPVLKDDVSVVIMAGGKGTRMQPFTHILPKPLIPVGDRSMLEVILDEYKLYFESKFYISVNYKANLIRTYMEDFEHLYHISYISEISPLGTAGALKFLEDKIAKPFFVSNCDILIKANYEDIYRNHLLKKNDMSTERLEDEFDSRHGIPFNEDLLNIVKDRL
jgi:hypothetical protein